MWKYTFVDQILIHIVITESNQNQKSLQWSSFSGYRISCWGWLINWHLLCSKQLLLIDPPLPFFLFSIFVHYFSTPIVGCGSNIYCINFFIPELSESSQYQKGLEKKVKISSEVNSQNDMKILCFPFILKEQSGNYLSIMAISIPMYLKLSSTEEKEMHAFKINKNTNISSSQFFVSRFIIDVPL